MLGVSLNGSRAQPLVSQVTTLGSASKFEKGPRPRTWARGGGGGLDSCLKVLDLCKVDAEMVTRVRSLLVMTDAISLQCLSRDPGEGN